MIKREEQPLYDKLWHILYDYGVEADACDNAIKDILDALMEPSEGMLQTTETCEIDITQSYGLERAIWQSMLRAIKEET